MNLQESIRSVIWLVLETLEEDLEEAKIRTENCVFLLLITFCNNSVTMFIFRTRPPPISQLTSTISLLSPPHHLTTSPPHLTLVSTRAPAPGHLLLQTSIHRRLCVKIKYCLALNKVGTACHRVVPPNTKVKKQMCAPNWMAQKNCTKLPKFKIGFRHKIKASSSPFAGFSNYRVAQPILLRWCLHSTSATWIVLFP